MIKTAPTGPLTLLAILSMAHLLLLSLQLRNAEDQILLRSWSLALFTPLTNGIHFLTEKSKSALQEYVLLRGVQTENLRLRMENRRLKVQLAQLQGAERLLSRTEDYRLLRSQYLFDTVVAGVVWNSSSSSAGRILINAGKRHGVMNDAAVLTPEGVVGRVRTSSALGAEVELLTSAGAAAGALRRDSRLQGVIQGNGSDLLEWIFIPHYENVSVGDTIVTSGMDQIYPKGLPIGRIVFAEEGSGVDREILVRPFADYDHIEEVIVEVEK